jgi:hypothetical protein
MSEKDIKKLEELALKKLQQGFSKEEALRSLQKAGILNREGEFTTPYQTLNKVGIPKA